MNKKNMQLFICLTEKKFHVNYLKNKMFLSDYNSLIIKIGSPLMVFVCINIQKPKKKTHITVQKIAFLGF